MNRHLFIFLFFCSISSLAYADEDNAQQLEEMVVYGVGIKQATANSAKPIVVLSGDEMRTKVGQTIGDTLSNELGITNQSFGAGVGAPVIRAMALMDPVHIVGYHTESCRAGAPPGVSDPAAGVPASELERMRDRQSFFSDEEQAYNRLQGTKPQTVGYALNDSPAGLAAWIVEKFRAWSDLDGHVEKKFTKDELLTNITIYWATETANSAGRLYYEARHPLRSAPSQPAGLGAAASTGAASTPRRVDVPSACVSWPKDVGFTPRTWNEAQYNLKRFTIMSRGGHFGAFEEPQLYVDDVREFFRDVR